MMKRMIALCLAVLLMVCALPVAQAQIATATVKGGWLKLRSEPSTSASSLDSYNTGTVVTILGAAGDWYYVQVPSGKQGYMLAKYLTVNPSSGESGGSSGGASSDLNIQAYVTSSNGASVRLRSGAGTGYSTLASYPVGTPATILSKSTYWFRVRIDGQTGYMMSQYLTTTKPSGGSSPVESYTAYVVSSNGGSVRMRSGAGTGYGTIAALSVGTQVTVLEEGATWSRIRYGSSNGYMMTQYLSKTKPDTNTPSTSTSYTAYVTSSNGKSVNVRSGAGTGYSSRGTLAVGTVVTVLSVDGNWCYITSASMTGYMRSDYLTKTPPSGGSSGGSSTPSGSYTAYVVSSNGGSVRLRKGAGTGYGTITELAVGTQVTVLSHGATWDYVRYGTTTGYMMSQYLSTTKPSTGGSSSTPPSTSEYTAYIVSSNGGKVNVRTGAGSGYGSKGQLPYGTMVTVLARGTSWSYITDGTLTGYVKNDYLSSTPPSGSSGSSSSTAKQVTGVTLSNLTPGVGETLRATLSPANASVNYAWVNDLGQVVSSNDTYTIKSSDVGRKIYLRVAGKGNYTDSAVSGWAVPQEKSSASITLQGVVLANADDPEVGSIISAAVLPSNAAATYAWYRSDGQMVGTSAFYVVKAEDVGMKVYCVATGAGSSQGIVASEMSGTLRAETTDIQMTGQVSLPMAALPGVTLRPAASLNVGEFACVWYVNGSVFSTGGALTVTDDMVGSQVYVVLSAITGSGYTGSVSSNACAIVQPSHATMTDLVI